MDKKEYLQYNKEFFEKWAKFYDIIEIAIKSVRKYIAKLVPKNSQLDIIDVCTGTGSLALQFAALNKFNVTGIDLSEAMLNQAQRKNIYPNLRFMKGDATRLPFEDSSFDICSISFGLHDMPHEIRLEALKEMVRIVKMSGYIIIADYNLPRNLFLQNLYFKFTKFYESEFYPSWYKGNYFENLFRLHRNKLVHNKTFFCGFIRVIVIKVKK